jgi:hypothetical protein
VHPGEVDEEAGEELDLDVVEVARHLGQHRFPLFQAEQ